MVAVSSFACLVDPLGSWWVPANLLLLPRGLLQIFLGRPSGLCCSRAQENLFRRKFFSPDLTECASFFSLPGDTVRLHPSVRCMEGDVVYRCGLRTEIIWHRRWNAGVNGQRRTTRHLYIQLPFLPSSGWRIQGPALKETWATKNVQLRQLSESSTYELGVVQFVQCSLR